MLFSLAVSMLGFSSLIQEPDEYIDLPKIGQNMYFARQGEEWFFGFKDEATLKLYHRYNWPFNTDGLEDPAEIKQQKTLKLAHGPSYKAAVAKGDMVKFTLGQKFICEGMYKYDIQGSPATSVTFRQSAEVKVRPDEDQSYYCKLKVNGGKYSGRSYFVFFPYVDVVPSETPRSLGALQKIIPGTTLPVGIDLGSDFRVWNPNGTVGFASETDYSTDAFAWTLSKEEKFSKQYATKQIVSLKQNQRLTYLGTVQAISLDLPQLPPYKFIGNAVPASEDFLVDTLHLVRIKNGPLKGRKYYVSSEQIKPLELTTGEQVVVNAAYGQEVVPAAFDIFDLAFYYKRLSIGDKDVANGMVKLKRVFLLKPGRTCYLIDIDDETARIHVGSGPHAGKKLYVARSACNLAIPDPWAK